jgi:hypothetical protein
MSYRSLSPSSTITLVTTVAMGLAGLSATAFGQTTVSEVTARPPAAEATVTARQQAWLEASPEQRVKLAEQLGEDGGRAFAQSKGWQPILDGTSKTIAQGPDQVYRSADGVIHVIEAKGGSGQLGRGYGHPQGSPEWAVESAKRMLRSSKTTAAEKAAAEAILRGAPEGKLEVHVVHTSHRLGEPVAAVLKQSIKCTNEASELAKAATDDIARASAEIANDAARALDDAARVAAEGSGKTLKTVTNVAAKESAGALDDAALVAAKSGGKTLKTVAKAGLVVGVVVDGTVRVYESAETERKFSAGEITLQQREVAHAKNAAGMAGGWGGALAGAELGAYGGGAAGSLVAPGPGTAVGATLGGIAGGVAGYFGGEAAAEAAAEWTVNRVHAAGTSISEAASKSWSWVTGW